MKSAIKARVADRISELIAIESSEISNDKCFSLYLGNRDYFTNKKAINRLANEFLKHEEVDIWGDIIFASIINESTTKDAGEIVTLPLTGIISPELKASKILYLSQLINRAKTEGKVISAAITNNTHFAQIIYVPYNDKGANKIAEIYINSIRNNPLGHDLVISKQNDLAIIPDHFLSSNETTDLWVYPQQMNNCGICVAYWHAIICNYFAEKHGALTLEDLSFPAILAFAHSKKIRPGDLSEPSLRSRTLAEAFAEVTTSDIVRISPDVPSFEVGKDFDVLTPSPIYNFFDKEFFDRIIDLSQKDQPREMLKLLQSRPEVSLFNLYSYNILSWAINKDYKELLITLISRQMNVTHVCPFTGETLIMLAYKLKTSLSANFALNALIHAGADPYQRDVYNRDVFENFTASTKANKVISDESWREAINFFDDHRAYNISMRTTSGLTYHAHLSMMSYFPKNEHTHTSNCKALLVDLRNSMKALSVFSNRYNKLISSLIITDNSYNYLTTSVDIIANTTIDNCFFNRAKIYIYANFKRYINLLLHDAEKAYGALFSKVTADERNGRYIDLTDKRKLKKHLSEADNAVFIMKIYNNKWYHLMALVEANDVETLRTYLPLFYTSLRQTELLKAQTSIDEKILKRTEIRFVTFALVLAQHKVEGISCTSALKTTYQPLIELLKQELTDLKKILFHSLETSKASPLSKRAAKFTNSFKSHSLSPTSAETEVLPTEVIAIEDRSSTESDSNTTEILKFLAENGADFPTASDMAQHAALDSAEPAAKRQKLEGQTDAAASGNTMPASSSNTNIKPVILKELSYEDKPVGDKRHRFTVDKPMGDLHRLPEDKPARDVLRRSLRIRQTLVALGAAHPGKL